MQLVTATSWYQRDVASILDYMGEKHEEEAVCGGYRVDLLIPAPVGNPIARKSRTNASWLHVVSGGGALATGLYGVVLERVYRESPGWTWMWVSSVGRLYKLHSV